jgi:hypothetical protein
MADDFQELCLKVGYAADVRTTNRVGQHYMVDGQIRSRRVHVEYRIGIKRHELEPRNGNGYMPLLVPYVGKVYCATVPNGLLYVRRNGLAAWCGNTQWELGGFAFLPASYIAPYFGGWAAKVLRLDPNDPNAVPAAE